MTGHGVNNLADRWLAARPVYLSDLDSCQPANALSCKSERGHWRTLDYETEKWSGTMLVAGPETAAAQITYPLRVSGWHAVSIGIYSWWAEGMRPSILARLSRDNTFTILTSPTERIRGPFQFREVFWKIADLSDQELVLGQMTWRVASGDGPGSLQCESARIAYVKLVPLSDAEVDALRTDRRRVDTRHLFAHNDAHGIHYGYRPTSAEEIRRHIEPYRDTDFSRLYWEAGAGDHVHYFSDIGRLPTVDGVDDFGRQGDRIHAESWRVLRQKGVDPFRVALDHAHDVGLEFHAAYRVAGFHYPPPGDQLNDGTTFFKQHPELRGLDREGNRTPRLAYSYPETRGFVVSLLREMAAYPINGVCLLYNRRPPLVEYEPPLVEGFQAEYGDDPRQIDPNDPRWLKYRARTLTAFMREVREAMNAVARERDRARPIEVSAVVMGHEEENLVNAIDVKAWIDEGVVDTLIPYTSAPRLDSVRDSWTDARDVAYFVSLTEGTACRLALNLLSRDLTSEDYRKKAATLYDAGVKDFFFWDCSPVRGDAFDLSWNTLHRLGHREEIEAWIRSGEPSLADIAVPIVKLGDWDVSYETPG